MPASDRRAFLRGAGLGLLSFSVAGAQAWLSPRQARAAGADLQVLTATEATNLEAIGEAFAPGARDAGVAWFVDHQLALPPNDCLLMAKYFNVPPPYGDFYRASLTALDALSEARHERAFAALPVATGTALLRELLAGEPAGWRGPPALLVYLVLRNDAVDVVYGTREGIEDLGVPYMAHIDPPAPW
jgi:hypothetical protein